MAKDKHTAKQGDSLEDLEVRLLDRNENPMDLTNANEVRIYMSNINDDTDQHDVAMVALPAQGDEEYPQRVRGPNVTAPLDNAGIYLCYFRTAYPTKDKRVPSKGYFEIEVEKGFE